jgi:hypothetical protein
MKPRLLGDENTSHKLVAACRRLQPGFLMAHLAAHNKDWCGLNDDDLLDACLAAGLILVAHDRQTLGDAATRAIRERGGHAGIILFRAFIRQADFGGQSRALCRFWDDSQQWDWSNRMAYIPTDIIPQPAAR